MTTQKQIEANRKNAKLSAGPVSVSGKRSSSMNALKHGVFAKHLLLPDDDQIEFGKLHADIHREWSPIGPTERALVERLVALFWRQRRFYRAEGGLFEMYRKCPSGIGGVATAIANDGNGTGSITRLLQMDTATEKSIKTTINMLFELQKKRDARENVQSFTKPSINSPSTSNPSGTGSKTDCKSS